MIYFDSSALVKRYLREVGSDLLTSLVREMQSGSPGNENL